MTGLHIVPQYAAVLGLLFLLLCNRVIVLRRTANIGFGAGGDDRLERAIRIQANFAEYVPLTLLLLAFAEARGTGFAWLHLLCLSLLAGRLIHAVGLARPSTDEIGRIAGMTGTQTALLGAVLLLLFG